jgi:hypothetical protein
MKYTIDRFEGLYAVVELENGELINILKEAIPSAAKEGDIISVEIDSSATKQRHEHIEKLMDDVWAD